MSICAPLRNGLFSSLLWTPVKEQLRFRNRPNLKKPLPLHFKRARALRLCEPIYEEKPKICDVYKEVSVKKDRTEESPYAQFLARDMQKKFYAAKMIAIFHCNPFIQHEFLRIRGMFFDANFDIEIRCNQNSKVGKMALTGTKFEPLLQIFKSHTAIAYCHSTDLTKFLKLAKKMPDFVLLGVILDNRLMHRVDFEAYAKSGGIDIVRSQLCNTLTSVSGLQLSSSLTSNIHALSRSLSALSENQNSSSSDSTDSSSPEVTPSSSSS